LLDDTDEYIFTQTRMIWGMSTLYKLYSNNQHLYEAAKQGVQFFIHHFWDWEYGGWVWKTKQDGTVLDSAKVTYGQVFAIYALSEYTIATKDPLGLEYAEKTFDLLQKYGADSNRGGYYENLESNWEIPRKGFRSSERKSLDIQMHVMEAFTVLALCSGKEIHLQKLEEAIEFILNTSVSITSTTS
jgi:mannobiose 2-epimerase